MSVQANNVGPNPVNGGFAGFFATAANGGVSQLIDVTGGFLGGLVQGSKVWVQSFRDSFTWYPLDTSTPDGVTVVKPTVVGAGAGRFIRDVNPSPTWMEQAIWYVDPTNVVANDENSGLTNLLPLKTGVELERRLVGNLPISQATTIWIQSSFLDTDRLFLTLRRTKTGTLTIRGLATTLFTSNVAGFTSVTNLNRATPTMGNVIDTNLANTWAALGFVGKRIRTTSGSNPGARAWIIKDENAVSAKQARTSRWHTYTIGVPIVATPTLVNVAVGDQYVIENLPTIANFSLTMEETDDNSVSVNGPGVLIADLDFYDASVASPGSVNLISPNLVALYSCSRFLTSYIGGQVILIGSYLFGSFSTGIRQFVLAYACGLTGSLNPQAGSSAWFDFDTVAQGVPLTDARVGGTVRIGASAAFDSSSDGIKIECDATCRIDLTNVVTLLYGNNNTAYGMRVAGQAYYTVKPTITGLTNDTIVGGTAKAYGAIPYVETTNLGALVAKV
jgi:hypothetical protein